MNGKCIEIGTLQAFLDGETAPETSLRISEHIALCDDCAARLAEAEEETAFVFSALDRELNSLVPTQRLWSRINESIEAEKSRTSVWHRLMTFVTVDLVSPSFAAAAGLLIVVGMLAVVWVPNSGNDGVEVVGNSTGPAQGAQLPSVSPDVAAPVSPYVASNPSSPAAAENDRTEGMVVRAVHSPSRVGRSGATRISDDTPRPRYAVVRDVAPLAAPRFLPGEESYIKTIAELRQSVDTKKDLILTPASRISYERDMAVVDDAIDRMRQVVRKNPRNQAARQILYSSYQDKIDLLNSVAQKEELIASLQ